VRWAQAATGRAAAAFFGKNHCNRTFRGLTSAVGVVAAPQKRAIWERSIYIFGESDGSFVFVGTESGTVTRAGQVISDVALQTQPADGSEQIRLCTARGLVYKAYRRPYSSGTYVLTLLASGYYEVAPWDFVFVSDGGNPNKYKLMEKVPTIFHHLRTYYSPCSCSHYGIEILGDAVTIEAASGEHEVRVEDFGQ
jgi:hypothetical protein